LRLALRGLHLCRLDRSLRLVRFAASAAARAGPFRFVLRFGLCRGLVRRRGLRLGHAAQRIVQTRDFFANQTFHIGEILFVARLTEHDGFAIAAGTPGAADPVNIVLGVAWHVKVEHMGHGGHIQSTRGHIGGHEDFQFATAKALKSGVALTLLQIAMDRSRVIAVFFQGLRDDIDIGLAVTKHDGIVEFLALQVDQRTQKLTFLRGCAVATRAFEHHHMLFDVLARGGLAGHFDAGRG